MCSYRGVSQVNVREGQVELHVPDVVAPAGSANRQLVGHLRLMPVAGLLLLSALAGCTSANVDSYGSMPGIITSPQASSSQAASSRAQSSIRPMHQAGSPAGMAMAGSDPMTGSTPMTASVPGGSFQVQLTHQTSS